MRSVILTAGSGDRLRPVKGGRPKCLATVGGCTILEPQYSDEEMKLRVSEISKSLLDGDSIGIAKFGATGAQLLVEEMDSAPSAFAGFCQRRPLHVVDHRGLPWIEIDSPNDYWRECTHTAPVPDDAVPAAGTAVRMAGDHV